MAKEHFSLVNLIGPVEHFDSIVEAVVVDSPFQIENAREALNVPTEKVDFFTEQNPYDEILRRIEDIASNNNIELEYRSFKEKINPEEIEKFMHDFSQNISSLKEKLADLSDKIEYNNQILYKLHYVENLDLSLDDLFSCKYIKFRFGRMPFDSYNKYENFIKGDKDVFFIKTSEGTKHVYGMYFTTVKDSKEVDDLFTALHFKRIFLPGEAHGTPKDAFKTIKDDIASFEKEAAELSEKIKRLSERNLDDFLSFYSYVKYKHTAFGIRRYALKTHGNFFIVGWLPDKDVKEFTARIDKLSKELKLSDGRIIYTVEKAETVHLATPPTALKNPKIFRPFEMFVSMYGLPNYNEIDPTPFVAITYMLLFGIMFGDLGQGLVLSFFGFLLYKLKGFKLGGIIGLTGLISAAMGVFYGSVFGNEELLPGFKALENSQNINITLMTTIGMGVVIIAAAMIINIINAVRAKDVKKAFFSPNGLSGLVFYLAVVIGVVLLFTRSINIFTYAYIGLFVIAPLLLIFLKEPLGNLITKNKQKIRNKGEFITENIFELLEVCLSYITNTISFVRVGAFALNHAGMMLVVYILAETAAGSYNPFILVLGNILVIGLEGLIVGIQVLRLEFYEIFSRFYDGNGREYKPLKINYAKERK